MEKDIMQIGSRLSVCRQNKNLTQEELAYRLGITPQALSKWERGVSLPDISMLADLARLLGVSSDFLLGLGTDNDGDSEDRSLQVQLGNNLRASLQPLELTFGMKLVPYFENYPVVDRIQEIRKRLSYEGILMPIVRIRDWSPLGEQEFMILSYQNVLYSQVVENLQEETPDYMFQKLEEIVRKKYHEILNPELVRNLVDNMKIGYPALIDGVIPEKIPYCLLTEVMKKVLARGDSACYLPKMIEVMACALYHTPELTADELAERIVCEIERADNFWMLRKSQNE